MLSLFFFFNDTATTEIYTLSLHDALPICEIVVALRARLQLLRQVALSCRQVGAHLWHRGPVVSRQQRDSNPGPSTLSCLRQAL